MLCPGPPTACQRSPACLAWAAQHQLTELSKGEALDPQYSLKEMKHSAWELLVVMSMGKETIQPRAAGQLALLACPCSGTKGGLF